MDNMKIGAKLALGFGIIMFCMIFMGISNFKSIADLNIGQKDMYIYGLSLSAISDADSEARKIVSETVSLSNPYLSNDIDAGIQRTNEAADRVEQLLNTYANYLNENQEDTRNLEQLKTAFGNYLKIIRLVQGSAKAGGYEKAAILLSSEDYQANCNQVFETFKIMLEWNISQMKASEEKSAQIYDMSRNAMVILIVFSFIVSFLLGGRITRGIVEGMKQLQEAAESVAAGNLTTEQSQKALKRKDEVGNLSRSLYIMQENMHKLIGQIVISSKELIEISSVSSGQFEDLNDSIRKIAAAADELSAGMEETAASSEELSVTAIEIDSAVENVAERTQKGARMADEIADHATDIKNEFIIAKEKADTTFITIQKSLIGSLQDAKAVEQVNSLADAILAIADQTNLLSLNAAIEAARAGESGKGFAVVADEIGALAENSKETAKQILDVAKLVVKSVDLLMTDSHKLMDYVESVIRLDYSKMLDAADDYSESARSVDEMANSLSSVSEELQASIQAVISTIDNVSKAADIGAATTATVAEQAGSIAENAEVVMKNLIKTRETSNILNDAVNGFTIYY